MRHEMRQPLVEQQQFKEDQARRLSERNDSADRLIEKWSKNASVGNGIMDLAGSNLNKARGLAFILENEEKHLQNMTETQISNAFSTTPENVIRIVRLAYPNSVRGELFLEWAMETARDSIYYLDPIYGKSLRNTAPAIAYGGAGSRIYDTGEYSYPSEEEVMNATIDGAKTGITATLTTIPVRPFTIRLEVNGISIAVDDGSGNFVGTAISTGTVNYTTGAVAVTLATALTADDVATVRYDYDSEVEASYGNLGSVELQLRAYQFRVKPHPLNVSWSKMTELLLNTTLNIDAEEAMIAGASDEVKKALDFGAVAMGYRAACANTGVTFDCTRATGESEISRMTAFSKAIDSAGDAMFNEIMRGGVTKLVGAPDAVTKISLHQRFSASNRQPKVGIYRTGSIDGVDIYKAPTSVIPSGKIVAIYKNDSQPEDVSLAFGTLIPLYRTQTLEFSSFHTETGLCNFSDGKVLNGKYLRVITLTNMNA